MSHDPARVPVPPPMPLYRRIALWVSALFLIPILSGASGAMAYFGLYRAAVTGKIVATSRGWQSSSSTISHADSPVSFFIFFALTAMLTGMLIVLTLVFVKLVFDTIRPRR